MFEVVLDLFTPAAIRFLERAGVDLTPIQTHHFPLTDAVEAEDMFSKLMGEEVEPRRQFIEDNALNVRNLDV